MALAPKLQLRQSQSLVMTPQLMQAIKLLQMSSLDLNSYVEAELERNPLLAEQEGEPPVAGEETPSRDETNGREVDLVSATRGEEISAVASDLDTDPATVYDGSESWSADAAPLGLGAGGATRSVRTSEGSDNLLEATIAGEETLQDHLRSQLALVRCEPAVRALARYLIDLIDECGYVRDVPAELAARLGTGEADVLAALQVVQGFDPAGIGARDLKECLALQLRDRNRLDPAMQALLDNLELLAKHDLARLRRICAVDDEDLADMIVELKRLDPKPGTGFGTEQVQTALPDVIVRPAPDGGWLVELNPDAMPRVLVDRTYHARVSRGSRNEAERTYVTECLQQANWLVRSLEQRARTILKVATEIVRQQDAFFAHGVRHLRPLTLRMVAEAVDLHESTVSRVTAQKYLATPRGLFEFKYFFTSAIGATEGGEAHSAESVRDRIRELIAAEEPGHVLSDDTIVKMLRETGVDIARRTVAKYRESLRIPSSVQRRREKLVRS